MATELGTGRKAVPGSSRYHRPWLPCGCSKTHLPEAPHLSCSASDRKTDSEKVRGDMHKRPEEIENAGLVLHRALL